MRVKYISERYKIYITYIPKIYIMDNIKCGLHACIEYILYTRIIYIYI